MQKIDCNTLLITLPSVLTFIGIFIEISPVKLSPISFIINKIGDIMLKDLQIKVDENVNTLSNFITEVDRRFDNAERDAAKKEAVRLRSAIIMFAEECRTGKKHTQNHFEEIFRITTEYYDYCKKHNLENHYIDIEHEYIRDIYRKCLEKNNFL